MTTRLTHDLTYDAPPAAVHAMLADPAFREAVCEAQHVLRREVRIEPDGAGMVVSIDQAQSAAGIPGFAKKIVGDEINIVQTETWADDAHADVSIRIPGKPGDIDGTVRLTGSGDTTTETVDLTIKVGIPLVGGKVESLVSDMLLKALQYENRVGREYLAR